MPIWNDADEAGKRARQKLDEQKAKETAVEKAKEAAKNETKEAERRKEEGQI